jgi:hypothetical protein
MTSARFARSALAALFASLLLVPSAQAKGPKPSKEGKPAAAAPAADAAGVLAVFGVDGKDPRVWPDPGATWKRRQQIEGRGDVEVTFAHSDRDIAKADRRVFEGGNPFRLPNGIYTFVILRDGTTSFGHPLDKWEVGTRHAHLAQGRPVVGAGEMVKSNAAIKLNLLSGTFMIPLIKNRKVPNAAFLERRIERWFNEVMRKKYQAPTSFQIVFEHKGEGTYDQQIIFDNKLKAPTAAAVGKLCGHASFKGNNGALCQSVEGK